MANDRLFMICRGCGQGMMIYKYYPGAGELTKEEIARIDAGNPLSVQLHGYAQDGEKIHAFVNKHAQVERCCGKFRGDLEGDRLFDLETENAMDLEKHGKMIALRD